MTGKNINFKRVGLSGKFNTANSTLNPFLTCVL